MTAGEWGIVGAILFLAFKPNLAHRWHYLWKRIKRWMKK